VKIFRVIIPVSDIEKATGFYRFLLGIEGIRVSPGRHYFNCEGVILACFDSRADGDDFDSQPNPDHIYMATDNLEHILGKVKELGIENYSNIETQPWGEWSFYMKDPFGNPLCFVQKETVFTGE
jgi:uncharacterized glyoxalase superfamily protein PhnB